MYIDENNADDPDFVGVFEEEGTDTEVEEESEDVEFQGDGDGELIENMKCIKKKKSCRS